MFNNNVVNLDEDLFNEITQLLITELSNLLAFDDIHSSYITTYRNDSSKGQINITILLSNDANIYFYKRIVDKINLFCSSKFNIPILFCVDYEYEYNIQMNKSSEILRIEELLNSCIIFDKTGYLNYIVNNCSDIEQIYNFNLISLEPDVSEKIAFELYKKKLNF